MKQQWRWSIVALVIIAVVLQGSGGRVDADVVQPQLAAPSPEFLRYDASAQSGDGAAGLALAPSPVDLSYLDGEHVTWLGANAALPASYDLRTEGRMTAVRSQGTSGACWTFATYGSLESNMMPAETLDFSENNLKNASGFDYGPNNGGNGDMSTAYLARWSGPIAEADDPYDQKSTTSPSGLSPIRHVQNVMMLPERPGSLDTADIKHALMDYGALVGSMYWTGNQWADTTYYKLSTGAYCYTGSFGSNHNVTVAGWDDAFPASNFSTPPPGNGAWIVKNSWGAAWGQSGYFFISYYDSVLFKKNPAYCFQAAEPTDNYTHVYQYDLLGHTGSAGYFSTTAWEANVFVATAAENVRAIGFYTPDVDCSYEAKVYGSWNGSTFSDLLSSRKGTIPSPGYHTIVLPSSGAPVASGQTFGVVVKLTTTNDRYPIALERPVTGYSMGATAGSGQSYMSSNGTSWTDVTDRYANSNVCVKAYAGTPSTTATLTLTSPNGGESWVPGSVQSVTWTVTGDTSAIHHFSLYYTVDGGNSWESIGFAPSAARSSSWTVPARFSSHAKVIVYAMNAASALQAYDASDDLFTIAPAGTGTLPAVTLVHPSGGHWTAGTTETIDWQVTGVFPAAFHHYAVYASLEDGRNGSWFNVGYSPTPSLSWAIPGAIGSAHAKIVVYTMDASSHLLADAEPADFVITPATGAFGITVTAPSSGATLHVGVPTSVTWNTTGTLPPVSSYKVYYSVDGGLSWEYASAIAVSPFSWTVPARLSSACKVMVVATDATGNVLGVATSSTFTIAP